MKVFLNLWYKFIKKALVERLFVLCYMLLLVINFARKFNDK